MIVYTAATGRESPWPEQPIPAEYLAFVDDPNKAQGPWSAVKCYDGFHSPNMNAKTHKVLAHQWLPDTECSLWMDATVSLKVDPALLVERFLKDADVAMFNHPERDCLYLESAVSALLPDYWTPNAFKYDGRAMACQVDKYRREGWPENAGLVECGVILRRHTPAVERFNEAWWSEICRHTYQDQISVLPIAKKCGVKIARIPGSIRTGNEFFGYHRAYPSTLTLGTYGAR